MELRFFVLMFCIILELKYIEKHFKNELILSPTNNCNDLLKATIRDKAADTKRKYGIHYD